MGLVSNPFMTCFAGLKTSYPIAALYPVWGGPWTIPDGCCAVYIICFIPLIGCTFIQFHAEACWLMPVGIAPWNLTLLLKHLTNTCMHTKRRTSSRWIPFICCEEQVCGASRLQHTMLTEQPPLVNLLNHDYALKFMHIRFGRILRLKSNCQT